MLHGTSRSPSEPGAGTRDDRTNAQASAPCHPLDRAIAGDAPQRARPQGMSVTTAQARGCLRDLRHWRPSGRETRLHPGPVREKTLQHRAALRHLLGMTGLARDAAMATTTVRLAAAGDAVAFARIVAAYHGDMTRVAYVVSGGDQEMADDAVQAAWSVAWQKLGSLRDPERLKSWLVSVAANEARQACRRQRRRAVVEIEMDPPDGVARDPADRAAALDLEDALRHLSADERALLALRYEAGLDSAEIGALAGRPAATVRWRLARLRDRLRRELSDA